MTLEGEKIREVETIQRPYEWLRFIDEQSTPTKEDLSLLGGKGYYLARMHEAGLPIPKGFTLTTRACTDRVVGGGELELAVARELGRATHELGAKTDSALGDPHRPLIVSVRSGAPVSMPGMMETVLNVGITDATLPSVSERIGRSGAILSYIRLIEMYGVAVDGVPHHHFKRVRQLARQRGGVRRDEQLSTKELEGLLDSVKDLYASDAGHPFEQNAEKQLTESVKAVFRSWMNPSAIQYRSMHGIPGEVGTAVTVQEMVFGNGTGQSGTAVIYTRHTDPARHHEWEGYFMPNAQGEQIVAGAESGALSVEVLPNNIRKQLSRHMATIEDIVGWVGDIEVTWENGRLSFLQARKAKLPSYATLAYAEAFHREGRLELSEALSRIRPMDIEAVVRQSFDSEAKDQARASGRLLTTGLPTSTGVATGRLVFSVEAARSAVGRGEKVILLCEHFNPNDVDVIGGLGGLVTTTGTPSSHIALVARALNVPCIMGCLETVPPGTGPSRTAIFSATAVEEGAMVSIDSAHGELFLGMLALGKSQEIPSGIGALLEAWRERNGTDNAWAMFVLSKDSRAREDMLRQCHEAIAKADHYDTVKARDAAFINHAFPTAISIPTAIVPLRGRDRDDVKRDVQTLVEALRRKGHGVWPRSAYGSISGGEPDALNSPYGSVDVGQGDPDGARLTDWLTNPSSSVSKWGGLDSWYVFTDTAGEHTLGELLIPADPPDKLAKPVVGEHFVFSLRATPEGIVVDMNDHTCHVRSLASIKQEDLMQIVAHGGSDDASLVGSLTYRFGKHHLDSDKLTSLVGRLADTSGKDTVAKFKRKLISVFGEGAVQSTTTETLSSMVDTLGKQGLLGDADYALIMSDRSLEVAHAIRKTVFSDWWSAHALPLRMWAIQHATGESQLECQGRLSTDAKNNWMLIYGLKGGVESTIAIRR